MPRCVEPYPAPQGCVAIGGVWVGSVADSEKELPAHVEEAIKTVADFHAQHRREATKAERLVEQAVRLASRPQFLFLLTAGIALWIAANLELIATGRPAFDLPPFPILQDIGTLIALYMAVLILITQNREKRIGEHRDQLTLELAILNEKKSAKLIQLVEELRRDSPHLANRDDPTAAALAVPANPRTILAAIKESHDEAKELAASVRDEADADTA
jgi:uncharacterized membrane protein